MEKVAAADFVIWNEGPPDLLRQQTQRLYQHFFMTEELDNTPSPAGDIPQETLPKPLPAPGRNRRGTAGCRSGGK